MGRPRCNYRIGYCPPYTKFKPEGFTERESGCVDITPEEIESLRLKNIQNLDQTHAATRMGVSQSTFQRVLSSAYKKVSLALTEGRELRIIGEEKRK
jgi:predicted DNA-binding protein (UPF0251 family)